MRHYLGPDMPLLAHMLNLGEPAFIQAQQQDASQPPPSPLVAPHPSPDPMPSLPRQSSPLPIPFGPAPTSGVVSTEPIPDIPSLFRPSKLVLETITSPFRDDDTGGGSFHESLPRLHPATPTFSPTLNSRPLRIKKLESKLKTKKRKLVLSDSENEEEAQQSKELDALLDLANAALHEPKVIFWFRLYGRYIPAGGLDSAGSLDSAGGLVLPGGVDSVGGLTSVGILIATGPTFPAKPLSPLRDPSKGKAVATPFSPVTAPTDKELAYQQATILEAERQELLEHELKQNIDAEQVYLDSLGALNRTNEEWIGLVDQVRANPTLSAELLRADVSEDTFSVRMSSAIYTTGWTWKFVKGLTDDQLWIEYDKIRRAVNLATAKDQHRHLKSSGETLESLESKTLKSSHSTIQPAELQETTSVSVGFSVSGGSSIPAATPIAAGVSTTAGTSGPASEASIPIIKLFNSPPKDTSLPLDPKTDELDEPLRKSSRKKSIARKRTLPSPSNPKSDALPFDKDNPEAAFKRYLRQASDDDEPAEPVSLALRFSTLMELMYWAGRADLMVLYGLVLDKYKTERATGSMADLELEILCHSCYSCEVVSADNAILAGVSFSAGTIAAAVVSTQFETELALMGLSTKVSIPVTCPLCCDSKYTLIEKDYQGQREQLNDCVVDLKSTQRQAELDRVALNLTTEEWIGLVDQVRANPTLSAELLGADVSKDTFSIRMVELMNRRRKAIAKMKAKAKREKPMTPAQQKEFMRTFETTSVSARDPIPAVISVSTGFSVSAASSIPAATPIAAGVSTTAGASGSDKEQDAPLRRSSRKKSIPRKRTLPGPSKPKYNALPFEEDDPEAEFKRYLRQASDDDEPAEPVSLALVSNITTWEIIPTEFGRGEIHVITRADGTVKRFSTLRELMYWAGRADLRVLYGLVSDKYKTERATGIGLGLWMDLRILITSREERDASIIWDDQDQWQIRSWRLYALPAIHVLETEVRDIMYMFVDKKYPLTPATLQRMLNHGLEIDRDQFGNDLTTAIQLIQSILN
nr:aminoacyl-tRNA synthetase, class 1a, anticodon-binding [Tanacetum cinerariifolium]